MTTVLQPDTAAPRNPYKGIRKLRKANWEYECELCGIAWFGFDDLFGAVARKQDHLRSNAHMAKALQSALVPFQAAVSDLVGAYTSMGNMIMDSLKPTMDMMASVLTTPTNIPHDPSLRNDKRKWGGR